MKLDIGLIRNVDKDLARRAAVVGFTHFAREIGCQLIAEGLETDAELRTVRDLGVELARATCWDARLPHRSDDGCTDRRRRTAGMVRWPAR